MTDPNTVIILCESPSEAVRKWVRIHIWRTANPHILFTHAIEKDTSNIHLTFRTPEDASHFTLAGVV